MGHRPLRLPGAIAVGSNGARALAPIGASLLYVGLDGYERLFAVLAGALALAGAAVLGVETSVTHEPSRVGHRVR